MICPISKEADPICCLCNQQCPLTEEEDKRWEQFKKNVAAAFKTMR